MKQMDVQKGRGAVVVKKEFRVLCLTKDAGGDLEKEKKRYNARARGRGLHRQFFSSWTVCSRRKPGKGKRKKKESCRFGVVPVRCASRVGGKLASEVRREEEGTQGLIV